MNWWNRLRSWFQRMFRINAKTIEEALGVRVLINQEQENKRLLWRQMIEGQAPWNNENAPSLMLPSGICNEISIYTVLELKSEIEGGERGKFLNEQWKPVIENSDQNIYELLASDSIIFKPFVRGNNVLYNLVTNDCFWVLGKNELGEATDVVFGDSIQKQVDGEIVDYTLLEQHTWFEKTLEYKITYRAFEYKTEINRNMPTFGIGREIPLTSVEEWSHLQPENLYIGIEQPIFVEVKMPKDKAVFADADKQIQKSDEQYGRLDWEFEGSELAVHADLDLFRNKNAKRGENPWLEMPKGKERLYRRFDMNVTGEDKNKLEAFAPTIRDESQARGLNRHKREIERIICLAFGTLSDPQQQEKTAEEVRAGKQRFFVVVQRMQKIMEKTYRKLAKSMDILTTIYNLAPIGEYDIKFTWGDSIMEDPDKEFARRKQLVDSGYAKPEWLVSWYLGMGYDPENPIFVEALKEIMPSQDQALADDGGNL